MYTSSQSRTLSKDILLQALEQCVHQHPALSAVVRDAETERPRLVTEGLQDLEDHLRFLDATHGHAETQQQLLEQIHNEPFSEYERRPQWKLYVSDAVEGYYIAFACSHALTDGRSLIVFHRTLRTALNQLEEQRGDTSEGLIRTSDSKLLAPLEDAADLPISWSFLLAPLLKEYLPGWLARPLGLAEPSPTGSQTQDQPYKGAASRPQREDPRKLIPTAVHHVALPPSTFTRLLATCKEHHARLTGCLNHCIAKSLSEALLIRKVPNATSFKVDTSIDLRRCIPDYADSIANLASTTAETLSAEQNDMDWQAVQRTSRRHAEASSTLADQPVGLLRYLTKFREWTTKNAAQPASSSFEMSNVGTFDGRSGGAWTVSDMVFSQSANGVGPPLNFNVASAKNGALNVVVTWWPGMLGVDGERAFVEEVCEGLLRRMEVVSC